MDHMFCIKCGNQLDDKAMFCQNCGAKSSSPAGLQPQAQSQQVQQTHYQPGYGRPPRRRHTGLWIFLTILVLIAAGIFYLLGSIFLLPPKDLGVKYTQADVESVMKKVDIEIDAQVDINKYPSISDYDWTFSEYEHRVIDVTPAEASAFFNEIAPEFWWFKDTQIKVQPDGRIITSSSLDIARAKMELFSDVAGRIPIPLPDKANIYTEGLFSVTDNKINMTPEAFNIGVIPLPAQYRTGENLQVFSNHLERFYTVIPGLKINQAYLKDDGNFVFDGIIPGKVVVRPK